MTAHVTKCLRFTLVAVSQVRYGEELLSDMYRKRRYDNFTVLRFGRVLRQGECAMRRIAEVR